MEIKTDTEATRYFAGKIVKNIVFDKFAIAITFTDGTYLSAEEDGLGEHLAHVSLRIEQSFDRSK